MSKRIDYNQVKIDAVGRWPGIFSALGISVGDGRHGPCPNCGGKDRFRFDDKEGKGTYFCNNCKPGDGWSLVMKVLGVDFVEAAEAVARIVGTVEKSKVQQDKTVSPERLRELFKTSKPIKLGDPVSTYLRNRGLETTLPISLRYCRKCWEPETKQNQEAMLAVFHSSDDEAVTIQRTYIKDGKKMNIESPRRTMTPLKKMAGGAVRLYDYEGGTLGVAEGVETAIAVHGMHGIPVWAVLSTSLMEAFKPPVGVKRVEIYGDNDANFAGQKAAYTLAKRLVAEKIKTHVLISEQGDFLDDLTSWEGPA